MGKQYKLKKQYRLPGYNYAEVGSYFVTINTKDRKRGYFGKIVDEKVQLSGIGQLADKVWNLIPSKFPQVLLDSYQIMPDHFHGILKIKSENEIDDPGEKRKFKSGIINNPMELEEITIGYIIRWFKGKVKFESKEIEPDFKWQPRFFDRIIRDDMEFFFIQQYIEDNPKNYYMDMDDEELFRYLNQLDKTVRI